MLRVLLLACSVLLASANNLPGKAVFWTHGGSISQVDSTSHITRTASSGHISDFLAKNAENFEVLAVLKGPSSLVADSVVADAVRKSASKTAYVNVYQDKSQTKISDSLGSTQRMSLDEFRQHLAAPTGLLHNGKLDTVEVNVESKEDIQSLALLNDKKVMLAVYEEPSVASVPVAQSGYSRLLSSDVSDGIYYKPEGAEYSIYYADTYLYITPDIFTGLLTGIFFFFTVLIGVTCLGSIQGMSMFYDKTPSVGREA